MFTKRKCSNSGRPANLTLCGLFLRTSRILLLIFFVVHLMAIKSFAQANKMLEKVDKQFFIENKGQWDDEVLYLTKLNGLNAWITKHGFTYDYYERIKDSINPHSLLDKIQRKHNDDANKKIGHVVKFEFVNSHPNIRTETLESTKGYFNYLKGNNKDKWISNANLSKQILIHNFDGISTRYYFDNNNLRHDYILKAGADSRQLKFKLIGSDKNYINDKKELVFTTRFGPHHLSNPFVYQFIDNSKKQIDCEYELVNGSIYGFKLGDYDHNVDLIIDPFVYSEYLGGTEQDQGTSISTDGSGNAYIVGLTSSPNFPISVGAYQTSLTLPGPGAILPGDESDGFVTKIDPLGIMVWSTFIGGSYYDGCWDGTIDASTDIYITGVTNSSNFPINGPSSGTYAGNGDAYVAKLKHDGSTLYYSTYISGANDDEGRAIAIDGLNNAYVTGKTNSNSISTFGGINNGAYDAYIAKADPLGNLVNFTFVGGAASEEGNCIDVNPINGTTAITGSTQSLNFPVTNGSSLNGLYEDAFVYKSNNVGGLLNSTYIGGSIGHDNATGIKMDALGNMIIVGWTLPQSLTGSHYPTTIGVCNPNYIGGGYDGFVTKFNPLLTTFISTFLGGSLSGDILMDVAIDNSGDINIAGYTSSFDYPVTCDAIQPIYGGGNEDVIYTKINSNLGCPLYSTFLGGWYDDIGWSIATDATNVYLTGLTASPNFPVTNSTPFNSGFEVFASKLTMPTNPMIAGSNSPVWVGCTLNLTSSGGVSYSWTGPNAFVSSLQNPCIGVGCAPPTSLTPSASGIYTVTITDANGCTATSTVNVLVNQYPNPCNNQAAPTLSGTINIAPGPSPQGWKIIGDLIINANMTFNDLDIAVIGAYSIIVNSGVTLTIKGTHIRGCNIMWKGIVVKSGGNLIINNNSLIEDANIAVNMLTPGSSILDVDRAIFNKNFIGISIANKNSNTYPYSIKGAIFTKRELNKSCNIWPYWYTVSDLQTIGTALNNVSTPYTLQGSTVVNNLLNGSLRCRSHILLQNIGQTTLAGVTPTYYEMLVGGTNQNDLNIFEYADFGIDGVNSNFTNINAVFQNMPTPEDGIGIRTTRNPDPATTSFIAPQYRLQVIPVTSGANTFINKFYNCFEGIRSTQYYTNIVKNNEFYSTQSSTLLTTMTVPPYSEINNNTVGHKAIDIVGNSSHNIEISNNSIYNHALGIYQVSGHQQNSNYPNVLLGFKDIRRNSIFDKPTLGIAPANTFIGDGIVINLWTGNGGTLPLFGVAPSFTNFVFSNKIVNAFRGITYSNFRFTGLESHINGNDISLMLDVYPKHNQYGIQTTLNTKILMNGNSCVGLGSTLSSPNLTRFSSYRCELNTDQQIDCNVSRDNFTGFKFLGVNGSTRWTRNGIIGSHYYGMSLGETLTGSIVSGEIGTQGSVTNAIDDYWLGTLPSGGGHTYVNPNANAVFSALWVRNNIIPTIYRPIVNLGLPPINYNVPGNLNTASSNIIPCGSPQPAPPPGPDPEVVELLENSVLANMGYISKAPELNWMAQQRAYEFQQTDSPYVNATAILGDFYTTNRPQAIYDINNIEKYLDAGNYIDAQIAISNFNVTNSIEQNYLDYYNLLMPYLTAGIWNDNVEGVELLALSNKCLFTDGAVVSYARVLYNSIYRNQYTVFVDDCIEKPQQDGVDHKSSSNVTKMSSNFSVELFPNPTNKGFDLKSNCKENCKVRVIISSITGQIILEKECNLLEGNCFIETELNAGTYLVNTLRISTNDIIVNKLIITN